MGDQQTGPIQCPKCKATMRPLSIEEIEIDRCEGCGGIWLDAMEKDALLASGKTGAADSGAQLKGRDSHPAMVCPRDHARLIEMVDLHQPQVKYESCKVCGGMFFDAGELRDLSRYTLLEKVKFLLRHGM